ncbi:hypothetical protein evm_005368 [Chilo suppressalis]|nr:hypothetical protein evm_005368 [Chilo suppressalis]
MAQSPYSIHREGLCPSSGDINRLMMKGVIRRKWSISVFDLRSWLKSKHVQGLEIHDAHKSLNRTKVLETVENARSALSSTGGGPLFLALPSHPELLAKYYDLRALVKKVDLMMVQTHALGVAKNMTYHPSRLSGLWDMMNTDSVVDLVVGLGVPASKVVISLPATAQKFTLLNETLSTPGSPTMEDEPKEIDQAELCRLLQRGRWTLERDQDLSGPYAFKNTTWISFEDASSVDVKGKYARVRGLAGLALYKADRDAETPCGPSLKASLAKVLNQQSRAPRAAILRSLEHEILSAPGHARALDALQVSPYRITQVVDSDGVIHSIREDTRTEFTCSRQGYFVHPRSCARFYRCVKFDQLSPEYTVFEFDCPAGLAFDSRYEVCVWPGSLPHSQACPGSSEIAPVPQSRFKCPQHEGYYADPENCRWFFACMDHGQSSLVAYEFRCPFGLGFDAERLKCDWPWLVPACGHIARYEAQAHGFSSAILTGAAGFQGQTADAVNVAAHQSLVSGASLDNLVGIQGGFLTKADSLDSNFIASQELSNGQYSANGQSYNIAHSADSQLGLVQATKYDENEKYTSGSIILDDYRLPTKSKTSHGQINQNVGQSSFEQSAGQYNNGYSASYTALGNAQYKTGHNYEDDSGAYVHDPSGDYAEPYRHVDSPADAYVHNDAGYKQSSDYYDYNRYSGSSQINSNGKYTAENSGQYVHDDSGAYVDTGSYNGAYKDYSGSYADYSGTYNQDNSGKYESGVYKSDAYIGNFGSDTGFINNGKISSEINAKQYQGAYSAINSGNYLTDSKAFTGASHTLTAGAVNVGLVGKTTLVDAAYTDQGNTYQTNNGYNYASTVSHGSSQKTIHPGHVSYISQPAVSIHHLGTDGNNLDGYGSVTTPTSSGIPTTATPFAVTTSLPVTSYKTTFVSEPPKSSVKQIFGIAQPELTYVKPAVIAVKQEYVTPRVEITDYNQADNSGNGYSYTAQHSSQTSGKSESSGYDYTKPAIQFEEGVTYTTPAPVVSVSTYKPQGFSHSQQTLHRVESVGFDYATATPVNEPQFKKLVAYTTGPSVSVQPTVATAQSYSHQTIHNVGNGNTYNQESNNGYAKVEIASEQPQQIFEVTTAQPIVVSSTYQPQVYSQETVHQVDTNKVNTYQTSNSGYEYKKPSDSGYKYESPQVRFEEAPRTVYTFSTPAPAVSTYQPQSYSHQTIHKVESQNYVPVSSTPAPSVRLTYQQPTVSTYVNPILQYTQTVTPTYVTNAEQEYKAYSPSVDVSSTSYESSISYQEPKTAIHYTTAQPAIALQPAISTYQPQIISHQTLHNVEASKVNTYSQGESNYQYQNLSPNYKEEPQTVIQISTPAPVVSSTYQPQTYSHQTIHKVEAQKFSPVLSTVAPAVKLTYQEPTVSIYENPLLKYTQRATFVKPTATVYTENYQPIVHQHEITHISQPVQYQSAAQESFSHQNNQFGQEGYSYSQPEIQRNEELISGKSYSDASIVSHQVYHQNNVKLQPEKDVVFVSTTPSTIVHEEHYAEYESPKIVQYKAPEYIPPRVASVPIAHQSSITHQAQDNRNYQSFDYSQQYETVPDVPVQQISFSTSHISQPRKESVHLSSFPGTKVVTKYKQLAQEDYKANEYLPPVEASSIPIVSSTYETVSSTTREYLPPVSVTRFDSEKTYNPSTTTQEPPYQYVDYNTQYQAPDYLPPSDDSASKLVNFESFGLKNSKESSKIQYNPYQEQRIVSSTYAPVQRKQNIVVETSKSNLLGFGTVGPDAGLVSTASFTTSEPIVSTTYRPIVKSTTSAPVYKYVESTTPYRAREYLPPSEESKDAASVRRYELNNYDQSNIRNPYRVASTGSYQRKQNIVVETAKSNLLGFGTVGPDAGLVSPVAYSTEPVVVSSPYSSTPQIVTTPYYKQEIVEVTPAAIPVRRTKPKVAVVTKINDFNPLLVRKLGAVCSCQSPVLVLKGKRPNVQVQQDFDDYSDIIDYNGRGDIQNNEWAQKSSRLRVQNVKSVTTSPVVTSTFNPIIVPDDSYYQDFEEENNYESASPKGGRLYSENYVSSTPFVVSTTEKVVKIRPRVKTVTLAPTYKTVLLNQEVAPTVIAKQSEPLRATVDSQAFDRYGPGGLRSRDETLQGSVDCQRAGLFRHPKQCNKFYACRWDCTKQRFTLHVFNCPVQLSFDESLGACNWPSQGPACQGDTLLTNNL